MHAQITLRRSAGEFSKEHIVAVVRPEEYEEYKSTWSHRVKGVEVLASNISGVAATKAECVRMCPTRFVQLLDDDITFRQRPLSGDWHCKPIDKQEELEESYRFLLNQMRKENSVHGCFAHEEGSNHYLNDFHYNTRYSRAQIYDAPKILELGIDMERCGCMHDMDISLQLIRLGFQALVCYKYSQGQPASGSKGGCEEERQSDGQRQAALNLKKFHPEWVKLKEKETKKSWGGGKRLDVVVAWAKCYKDSKQPKQQKELFI